MTAASAAAQWAVELPAHGSTDAQATIWVPISIGTIGKSFHGSIVSMKGSAGAGTSGPQASLVPRMKRCPTSLSRKRRPRFQ